MNWTQFYLLFSGVEQQKTIAATVVRMDPALHLFQPQLDIQLHHRLSGMSLAMELALQTAYKKLEDHVQDLPRSG